MLILVFDPKEQSYEFNHNSKLKTYVPKTKLSIKLLASSIQHSRANDKHKP